MAHAAAAGGRHRVRGDGHRLAFLARYTAELVKAVGGAPFEINFPTPTVKDAVDQFLKNVGQAGILTAILLTMGSVATEKERGTAALLLSQAGVARRVPVREAGGHRRHPGVSMVLASAVGYLYTALLFEAPSLLGWAGHDGAAAAGRCWPTRRSPSWGAP